VSEPTFLDSGIFIAFLNRRDQWHEDAVALFKAKPARWYTSLLVVAEAYSWFLHRMGEESARTFTALLASLTGLKLFDVTGHHHRQVLATLDRFRGTKLTYVDASSLCFLKRYRIKLVWSTDHHLALTGARILPR
jgi:predicted nucleic acid-binding protein